jgi:hypothetical protein
MSEDIAVRVHRRAIVMLFMSMRFEIEMRSLAKLLYKDDNALNRAIKTSLSNHSGLYDELTKNERILLKQPIGSWSESVYVQYSWHIEGCGCLLWALNELKKMPLYITPFDVELIDIWFGTRKNSLPSDEYILYLLGKDVKLRSEEEIEKEYRRWSALYQRSLIADKIRSGKRNVSTKKYTSLFPLEELGFDVGSSGDILVGESRNNLKEFCDLTPEEENSMLPLSLIRTQTFEWIRNPTCNWDDITLDILMDNLPE